MRLPKWDRRTFLASLGAVTGAVFGSKSVFAWAQSRNQAMRGFGQSGNVYEELGVTTVINGQGTMTVLGGSLPRPEILQPNHAPFQRSAHLVRRRAVRFSCSWPSLSNRSSQPGRADVRI